jgi:Zn-dependent peptidase ImmA (M78 family)
MGLSVEEAAQKVRTKPERLERAEHGDLMLTMRQAERAAKAYERPLAALFASKPPEEEPQEAQFRRLPGAPEPPWPSEMIGLVRRVRDRQAAAADLYELLDEPAAWPETRVKLDVPANSIAPVVRELLGISFTEQRSWHDQAGYMPLRHWTDAVEELGILVIHDGSLPVEVMRGFASLHEIAPAIVVNTQDDPRSRALTIIHELGHLYGALRSESPSEPWLEKFAGEVLMPRAHLEFLLSEIEVPDLLRRFDMVALEFGVTPKAAIVRAVREQLISQREAHETLERLASRAPRARSKGGNYYWTQLARLSPAYTRLVFSALESQTVTYAAASSLLGGVKVNNFEKLRGYLDRRAELA